jgi:hypothetical protein
MSNDRFLLSKGGSDFKQHLDLLFPAIADVRAASEILPLWAISASAK